MHEVLVNRLGGLSLPRKSVVRLTDRPDMTLDVYRGRKTTNQQQFTGYDFRLGHQHYLGMPTRSNTMMKMGFCTDVSMYITFVCARLYSTLNESVFDVLINFKQ